MTKVEDLREQLQSLGLDSKGLKPTLKDRLRKHLKKIGKSGVDLNSSTTTSANTGEANGSMSTTTTTAMELCHAQILNGTKTSAVGSASNNNEIPSSSTTSTSHEIRESNGQYDFYLCFDVEATCERGYSFDYPNEIIEFPIVLLDGKTFEPISEFHSYVRPENRPILSEFCLELTGIQQTLIDQAPTFTEVLVEFEAWLRQHNVILENDHGAVTPTIYSGSSSKEKRLSKRQRKLEKRALKSVLAAAVSTTMNQGSTITNVHVEGRHEDGENNQSNNESDDEETKEAEKKAAKEKAKNVNSMAALLLIDEEGNPIEEKQSTAGDTDSEEPMSVQSPSSPPPPIVVERKPTFCFVTDGPFDIRDFVGKQCIHSNIPRPFYFRAPYLDIRTQFKDFFGLERWINLESMLLSLGEEFEGRQHSGICDARMVALITRRLGLGWSKQDLERLKKIEQQRQLNNEQEKQDRQKRREQETELGNPRANSPPPSWKKHVEIVEVSEARESGCRLKANRKIDNRNRFKMLTFKQISKRPKEKKQSVPVEVAVDGEESVGKELSKEQSASSGEEEDLPPLEEPSD